MASEPQKSVKVKSAQVGGGSGRGRLVLQLRRELGSWLKCGVKSPDFREATGSASLEMLTPLSGYY